jgi:phage shock protein PspC (stress-responsive transcriptional regulator)
MKKTISINLNSFFFNIDEDAYIMLKTYLEKLEFHFSKSDEGNEIIKDIEARIAEIFNMKISNNKQVINISDVNDVINILGNVEDITGNSDTANNDCKNTKTRWTKKLYRDPDNKKIAGICAGLSAYTGVDAVFWRILFITFLFIPFLWIIIIVYAVLWMAIPEAKTIAEKIEMKEGKIDLSDIGKNIKEEYDNLKETKNINNLTNTIKRIGNTIIEILSVFAKAIGKIIGVALILISIAVAIGIFVLIFRTNNSMWFYNDNILNFVWLPNLLQYLTSPTIAWVLSILLGLAIIIPIIAILYFGISLLFRTRSNKKVNSSIALLWIISIIVSICMIIAVSSSFHYKEQKSQVSHIKTNTKNNTYEFSIGSGKDLLKETKFEYHKKLNNNEKNIAFAIDDDKILFQPKIMFNTTDEKNTKIKFTYSARGINSYIARKNIEYIEYNYNITDSITYFDPYFVINKNSWYFQNIRISVSVPVGQKIKVNQNLENMSNFDQFICCNEELYNYTLIATTNGFVKVE